MSQNNTHTKLFVRDRGFYRVVLSLAIPMTLQNVMQLLLNMMDTVMLGRMEGEYDGYRHARTHGG